MQQRTWGRARGRATFASVPVGRARGDATRTGDGHDHFHLKRAMRYSLWNLDAHRPGGARPEGRLLPLRHRGRARLPRRRPDPEVYTRRRDRVLRRSATRARPTCAWATSAGWRDVYGQSLAYQWIDVSDTPPGTLRGGRRRPIPTTCSGRAAAAAEVNAPAFSSQPVTVPGWVAQPVAMAQTGGPPRPCRCRPQKFGTQSDANLRYRVVTPPGARHPQRSPPARTSRRASPLVYTPAPGLRGRRRLHLRRPLARLGLPDQPPGGDGDDRRRRRSVAISGAPASMVAGTSAQLTATVTEPPRRGALERHGRVGVGGRPLPRPEGPAGRRRGGGAGGQRGRPGGRGRGADPHHGRPRGRPPGPTPGRG